jgi:hypothetical protein
MVIAKRRTLQALTRPELLVIADTYGLQVEDQQVRDQFVEAAAASRTLDLAAVLGEPETRPHLAGAPDTLARVDSFVASCPTVPGTAVPVVRCGPAVLATLPTRSLCAASTDEQGVLRAVVQINRSQASYADLVTLRAILRQHDCSGRGQRYRGLAPGKVMGGVQRRTAPCGPSGAEQLGPEDRSNHVPRWGRCRSAVAPTWLEVHSRPCDRRSRRGNAFASERSL